MKRRLFMIVELLLTVIVCRAASGEITRIVAFGDSMTDTGNLYQITGGTVPALPSWEGRSSNGPVWVEYLADAVGVLRPEASRLGGTNAAVGGAPTGEGAFFRENLNVEIPRVGRQIEELLAAHTLNSNDLVVVWAGFVDRNPSVPGGPLSPEQTMANLTDHITELHAAGAKNFLVGNVAGGGGQMSEFNSQFNSLWSSRVNELRQTLPIRIYLLNFSGLVGDVVARPEEYGLRNDFAPIINREVANPDEYAVWDNLGHPTTALHRVIAQEAVDVLRPVEGDYNGDAFVDQSDLDLVLLNWGDLYRPAPEGWVNDLPTRLFVDQDELDGVLRNWGERSLVPRTPPEAVSTPEPDALVLVLVALFASRRCVGGRRCVSMAFILSLAVLADSAFAQFSTVINVPPDPAPTSIGSHTQLNVLDGGHLPSIFQAGLEDGSSSNVQVNIFGGKVGEGFQAQAGSLVNISGGTVEDFLFAGPGSQIDISGGTVGDYFGNLLGTVTISGGTVGEFFDNYGEVTISGGMIANSFHAQGGSKVTISAGTFGDDFRAWDDSEVNISGGTFGKGFSTDFDSNVTISGGEFLLWGVDRDGQSNDLVPNAPTSSTVRLTCFDPILAGTLEDGSPFIFNVSVGDSIGPVTLASVPLPAIDTAPMTIDSEIVPNGLRQGQTLTLVDGGVLPKNFAAVNSMLNIAGGRVGDGLELVGSQLTLSGGTLGTVRSYSGNEVTIVGGEFLIDGAPSTGPTITFFDVLSGTFEDGSPFIFSRAAGDELSYVPVTLVRAPMPSLDTTPMTVDSENAPNGLRQGQTLTLLDGGVLGENFAAVNATLNIAGGEAGDGLEVVGARVSVSGGTVGRFRALAGSLVSISGGTVENGFSALRGSQVDISGGAVPFLDAQSGSQVNLYGSEFLLDGSEITDAMLGQASTIASRDVSLTGVLGDGTAFRLGLARDSFSPQATLTVTRISLLEGDYNSNGTVEQADLDLVLLNWGQELFNPYAAGWINDLPSGPIDQEELDKVLLKWGSNVAAAKSTAAVPEPASCALLLVLTSAVTILRLQWKILDPVRPLIRNRRLCNQFQITNPDYSRNALAKM